MFDPRFFYLGLSYVRVIKYVSEKISYQYYVESLPRNSDYSFITPHRRCNLDGKIDLFNLESKPLGSVSEYSKDDFALQDNELLNDDLDDFIFILRNRNDTSSIDKKKEDISQVQSNDLNTDKLSVVKDIIFYLFFIVLTGIISMIMIK
ncbi:MAG: hypothetical protein QXZ43_04325 [Candidatus Aenigmatarchaeota archaeon]